MTTQLAVFISGDGNELQMIIDAIRAKYLEAEIVVVVANRSNALGLQRAQKARIPTIYHSLKAYRAAGHDRRAYDAELATLVKEYQPDWIILAGWTHLLSDAFLQHFSYRVVNLHLALPGKFPGAHAITDAFAAFDRGEIKQTGVTVHLVADERINRGTTLATQDVPIYRGDTLGILTHRVRRAGSELLVNAVRRLIQGDDER
ncbi:MAG: phosphoribosylglycinamide formyltransferase [Chloroflexi bacterium]|nr:phosphoribosylglycinamide formyltransferase [Chloroflexota bacterium]